MLFGRSITVCREGWYYLLVLGFVVTGSFLREVNLLLVLAGMMFFPFLLNIRTVMTTLRGLKVRRRLPDMVTAGETFHVDLTLSKSPSLSWLGGGASWVVHAQDRIRSLADMSVQAVPLRLTFWRLVPGQQEHQGYRCCLANRGRYQIGPLKLTTGFPLGLVRADRQVKSTDQLVVLPRLGQLTNSWRALYQEAHQDNQISHPKHGVIQGEFHGLRDWRAGDDWKRIHWRTTARRGAPVVREYQQNREQQLVLLIDIRLPGDTTSNVHGTDDAHKEFFETLVSFAATVVTDVCQRGGSLLYLGLANKEPSVRGGPSSTGLMRDLLESLAVLSPASEDHLPRLLGEVVQAVPRATTTVLVSPRVLDSAELHSEIRRQQGNGHLAASRFITICGHRELSEYFLPELPSAARSDQPRPEAEPSLS